VIFSRVASRKGYSRHLILSSRPSAFRRESSHRHLDGGWQEFRGDEDVTQEDLAVIHRRRNELDQIDGRGRNQP